jgi:activator of HSP90 ATPase
MEWRLKTWASGHHSDVTIDIVQGSDNTTLKLTQQKVPVGAKSTVEQNWSNYYWNSIKRTFGYGALL